MNNVRGRDEKMARRQKRQQDSAADAAFDAGDYKTALSLYLQAAHAFSETPLGHRAMMRAQLLRLDPVGVYAGLGTTLLLALAALWALSN